MQFLNPDDYKAHEARVCIAEGYVLGDRRRPKHCTEEQYFKTQAEMAELFADIPAALANTVELAKRCNLTLELGVNRLPLFPTPNNQSPGAVSARSGRGGSGRTHENALSRYGSSVMRRCQNIALGWISRLPPSYRWGLPVTF